MCALLALKKSVYNPFPLRAEKQLKACQNPIKQKSKEEKKKSLRLQTERGDVNECALPKTILFVSESWMEASAECRAIPSREHETNKKIQTSIQAC